MMYTKSSTSDIRGMSSQTSSVSLNVQINLNLAAF